MGLLIQEGAGARGAHGVHGEVLDHQVAVNFVHQHHLGALSANVDDGAGLRQEMVRPPSQGDDFVDEEAAQDLSQEPCRPCR